MVHIFLYRFSRQHTEAERGNLVTSWCSTCNRIGPHVASSFSPLRWLSVNFLSLTLCYLTIFNSIDYRLSNYVIIVPLLLIYKCQSFSTWSDSSNTKSAPLWAQIALCTLKQNTERYYLPLNGGKKLNNPRGCRVGDYEAAKLC